MIQHHSTVHITCPVEHVFAFLADHEKLAAWQSNLVTAESLTPGPIRQGSRFLEVRRFGNRETEVQAQISEFEPNRRLSTQTSSKPEVHVSYSLTPEQGGTLLSYSFEMRPTGLMWFLQPVILSATRKQSDMDLARLKQLLDG